MQVAASYHHRIIIVVIEVFDDSFLDENSKKIAGKSYPKWLMTIRICCCLGFKSLNIFDKIESDAWSEVLSICCVVDKEKLAEELDTFYL